MPQIIFNDVTLAFTNCMLNPSDFGGYNYSFVVNKDCFCDKVRQALAVQKTQIWPESKNTNEFILTKCNAKSKDDVTFEPVKEMMGDDDVLVQVKSKNAPIENTKNVQLGRGTTADILIDVFEYSYGKKDFICIRSHADKGCTVKVNKLSEFKGAVSYFEKESTAEGFNKAALDVACSQDPELELF